MLAQLNDCIGGLLHLGPNVITFRALLHLGPNVITFRTLFHLGQLLHLGLQQSVQDNLPPLNNQGWVPFLSRSSLGHQQLQPDTVILDVLSRLNR